MNPDPVYWGRWFGWLAGEGLVVVGLAAAWAACVSRPGWRRAGWLASLLGLGLVWIAEAAGVREGWGVGDRAGFVARDDVRVRVEVIPVAPKALTAAGAAGSGIGGSAEGSGVWWPAWIWASGAGVCLMAMAWEQACLMRRRRRSVPVESALARRVAALAGPLGLGRVEVRVWPGLRGPVALGWWRPCLALPADFDRRFRGTQGEAVLAHELGHLVMRDPCWLALARAVCALAWWHPGSWWALGRLRRAMEMSADEASAVVPGGREALAAALVALGRELVEPDPVRGLGVGGAGLRSELAGRVLRLLESEPRPWMPARSRGGAPAWGVALAILGLLAAALPGPGVEPPGRMVLNRFRAAPPVPEEAGSGGGRFLEPDAVPPSALDRSAADGPAVSPEPVASPASVPDSLRAAGTVGPVGPEAVAAVTALADVGAPPAVAPTSAPLPSMSAAAREAAPALELGVVPAAGGSVTGRPPVLLRIQVFEVPEPGEGKRSGAGLTTADLDREFAGLPAGDPPVFSGPPTGDLPGATFPKAAGIRVDRSEVRAPVRVVGAAAGLELERRLRSAPGVRVLSSPSVTTPDGHQAQVQVAEIVTLVTGVETRDGDGTSPGSVNYLTEPLATGPSVEVRPRWEAGAWNLEIRARMTEFLGYDDPGPVFVEVAGGAPGAVPLKAQLPLPRLRVRDAVAEGRVGRGETLVVRGAVAENRERVRRGLLRRDRVETTRSRLYFLVTPDPAGAAASVRGPERAPAP